MVEVGIAHMLILCAAQSLLPLTIETEQNTNKSNYV